MLCFTPCTPPKLVQECALPRMHGDPTTASKLSCCAALHKTLLPTSPFMSKTLLLLLLPVAADLLKRGFNHLLHACPPPLLPSLHHPFRTPCTATASTSPT